MRVVFDGFWHDHNYHLTIFMYSLYHTIDRHILYIITKHHAIHKTTLIHIYNFLLPSRK